MSVDAYGSRDRGETALIRDATRQFTSFGSVGTLGARRVIGAVAATRIVIGAVAMVSPRLFTRGDSPEEILMARSFAGREMVLGFGGCLGLRRVSTPASRLSTWAGLGVLTDASDLFAAIASIRRGQSSARTAALLAIVGLAAEGSALAALHRQSTSTDTDEI